MQPFLNLTDDIWLPAKDGDPSGRAIFRRHYSYKPYRDGRDPKLYVGPGEKLVLLTADARALFVWRKFVSRDGQEGINCAVFRNEGSMLGSELVREADRIADMQWPGERHYTYVNPRKVKGNPPGNIFLRAGWRRCGITKWNKLLILERAAPDAPTIEAGTAETACGLGAEHESVTAKLGRQESVSIVEDTTP